MAALGLSLTVLKIPLTISKLYYTHTFNTSTTILQHSCIHLHSGLGQQLVSCQVRVVGRSDEVVTKGLIHILMHFTMQWIENITSRTAHEVGETFEQRNSFSKMPRKQLALQWLFFLFMYMVLTPVPQTDESHSMNWSSCIPYFHHIS